MAFKLSKEELKRRTNYFDELTVLRAELEDAINVFNAEVEKLKEPVTAALTKYNEVVEQARGFAEDIAREADEEIDSKSDKWRDGEKGQAAILWKDEWERADLSDFEITFPDELPGDLPEHPEILDGLPTELEE